MDAQNSRQISDLNGTVVGPVRRERPTSVVRLRVLADLDQRSRAARINKKIIADYTRDVGGNPTAGQQQVIRDIALIGTLLDHMTTAALEGCSLDIEDLNKLFGHRRRMIAMLGLERRARPLDEATLLALVDQVEEEVQ